MGSAAGRGGPPLSMLVDPWTLGHVGLGFGLAWLGFRFGVVFAFALAWELVEGSGWVPGVGDPEAWNTFVDVLAVGIGWAWHVAHGLAAPRARGGRG